MPSIIGREADLAVVREFVSEARERTAALEVQGPAGIGKSTVWQAAMDEAGGHEFRVVSTRPSEAEAQLPFAALNDLFGTLLDELALDVPAPQRMALDTALLRVPPSSQAPPEPLAISLATLALVRAGASSRPMLIAIDDAQWLDTASLSVLAFVVRRLDTEPVGILTTQRTSGDGTSEASPTATMVGDRRRTLQLTAMSARETGRLLATVPGLSLPPSSVARVHQLAAGNPFYAIEIGRAMQRRGLTRIDRAVSVPSSLRALVLDRLAHLPPAGAAVVRYASALSQPTIDLLEAVLGRDDTRAGLSDAIAAQIVVATGRLVRFTHPLLAAETYERMGEVTRLEVHRRLADVVTAVEERAMHLDLSTTGDDEAIATVLDDAAARANERGAPEAAADYAERATRRTSAGAARVRRQLVAGRYRLRAGDVAQARAWLESALADADVTQRGEVLLRLGEVRLIGDDWRAAERLFDAALDEAELDDRLRIEAMVQRAGVSFVTGRHEGLGLALITEALRLAEEIGDPAVLARVLGPYATWQWAAGHGNLDEIERRASELGAGGEYVRVADHFDTDFAALKSWNGDHEGARAAWDRVLKRAEERGDYSSIPLILIHRTRADFYAGRAEEALARLEEAESLARTTGQGTALMTLLEERAIVNARLGRPAAAWEAVRAAVAQLTGMGIEGVGALRVREELAVLELSRDNYQAALEALGPEVVFDSATDAIDSTVPTRAEVLMRLGRLDEAEAALERFIARAVGRTFRFRSADVDAGAGRVAALLAAARGDLENATKLVGAALEEHRAANDSWSRARTLLVAADIDRRARRRADAHDRVAEALALFEHFGADLWAQRAREQLERIRATGEQAGGLTTTQAQVADLAAAGLTNRQIADRLFMSVHTVEAHLSAAYRALGIRSRRELADAMHRVGDSRSAAG